jgi:hypothetical protein
MNSLQRFTTWAVVGAVVTVGCAAPSLGQEIHGRVNRFDVERNQLVIEQPVLHKQVRVQLTTDPVIRAPDGSRVDASYIKPGARVTLKPAAVVSEVDVEHETPERGFFVELWQNFTHNLFKPLLLFFYLGFLIPIFRVKFEFPYVVYQALTIYLLLAIGWHGGEELAQLDPREFGSVIGFMGVGFLTNLMIGLVAYVLLSLLTRMRRVDKATVAGYYGSDSAGTFVTALGVLASVHLAFDAYMPVMLAVMEIPGCLVALWLVSRLRSQGMDALGNMPDEPGYDPTTRPAPPILDEHGVPGTPVELQDEEALALEKMDHPEVAEPNGRKAQSVLDPHLLHEVLLNPGLFLLFGGIVIGFISRLQGAEVVRDDDNFFVNLFQGVLCLFLLEMGMTASRKLRDLKTAGPGYIVFALVAPNLFAVLGILTVHGYAWLTHHQFQQGTYVLFSVLCAAASYIAVPAVQRLAIPEASPTLPLAASLGLTFSYNVTMGIPLYIQIAKTVTRLWPVG